MVLIVAAVGRSGSGKTFTLEYLTAQLSKQGYKIGTIKHVHHLGFTIDTKGTNTWRYAQAGAKVVAAISPEEVSVIKRTKLELNSLDQVIAVIEQEPLDIIFIEGFHALIAKRADVSKIITAKDTETLQETLQRNVEPILAVSGVISKNTDAALIQGVPVIRIPEEGERLVELVKQQLAKTQKQA
ncbi:MAG: molybdopterin-guanine dinucleotide biosynthesis protein B [Candidatus Bathyarchaeia archaeon]|jgi:molybdopterin-guanine dinucleotide biosynthesis protein MobB